jgi:hypothetical protein
MNIKRLDQIRQGALLSDDEDSICAPGLAISLI